MQNHLLLLEQLKLCPEDETLAMAAVDAMVEDLNCGPGAAVLQVMRERQAAFDARAVGEATELLRPEQASGQFLASLIRRHTELPGALRFNYLVIPGDQPPIRVINPSPGRGPRRHRRSILVGATWVKQQWAERQTELERRRNRATPTSQAS